MKTRLAMIVLALIFGSFQVQATQQPQGKQEEVAAHQNTEEEAERELEYFELVMNIFRYHVKALETLTASESRYSDNAVFHANAIWHTSNLLDHVYPGEAVKTNHDWGWKNEKEFDERAQANRRAAKELRKAAHNWLEKKDEDGLLNSLENLKDTCRNCHGKAKDWP